MKSERPAGGTAVAILAAVGLVACCGFPVLLSVGAGITFAGVGLRSWVLAIAGLLVVVIAGLRLRRHQACKTAAPADHEQGGVDADRHRTR